MTAGTKLLLLLSVGGMVVLIVGYGGGPDRTPSQAATPAPPSPEQLLMSTSIAVDASRPSMPEPRHPAADRSSPATLTAAESVATIEMGKPLPPTVRAPVEVDVDFDRRSSPMPSNRRPVDVVVKNRSAERIRSVDTQSPPTSPLERNSATTPRMHTVEAGQTLGHLAQTYFGSARDWHRLVAANPEVDPDRLRVGQQLVIPARESAARARRMSEPPASSRGSSSSRTHTVTEGDTLSSIAETYLGSEGRWSEVYELNVADIGEDPNSLMMGLVITLPEAP